MKLVPEPTPDTVTLSDKVVPFNEACATRLAVKSDKELKGRACPYHHKHICVCEKNRTITCDDCGFIVDPFDYLNGWAKEGDKRMDALKALDVQKRVSNAELADLERKILNARGVLKRAGKPQPMVERQKFDSLRLNPHLAEDFFASQPPPIDNPVTRVEPGPPDK